MNVDELSSWQLAVSEHMDSLDTIINDRKILKKHIEDHLKQFFEWDDIEYNRDFTCITLSWKTGSNPFIKQNIGDLMMDWIIRAEYDDVANRIVVIDVYPFGVIEE